MHPLWWLTKDGDRDCLALYERHYSAYRYRDGRTRKLFAGPGEKVVLRTEWGNAMFVWRKFIDGSGQQGINCAVFRNESTHRSSGLIRQADAIADCLWPDSRHYTYVDPTRVASKNPGFCFIAAGWRRCGRTKGGLVILERAPRPADATTPDLFGREPDKPRGKHYVEPRGYAAPPGTGPAGETCGTCQHARRIVMGKTFHKCALAKAKWTHGRKTDVLAGSPACSKWEERE